MSARALELAQRRVPFVHARVVRAQAPASARPGDEAIVYGDGTIDGFVGGLCAEGSVRTAALGALNGGGPLLLRVLPAGEAVFPDTPGARVVVNPCLSGGALEIFLEPVLPPPLIEVVGTTPIAEAFVALADVLGYATTRSLPDAPPAEHTGAVIVAGQGRGDAEALRTALDAGVGHIALVASRRRGAALLDELGLTDEERIRVHTPAGLDIGARTAPEVALSILAEVVEAVRARPAPMPERAPVPERPPERVDPVCGMTVTVTAGTPHLAAGDEEFWFCGTGCRDRYAAGLVG
ncbi:XdhC family protein [Streptomyces sp. LP11]|uniref:XdhC family protein n=1 Tax=Streptomyces pyxinicus TaxID=2970331 RepID=A0ABT2AV04_9ACTN|nr:XdhC family protein [Streptomyces sp. LP11]MCS0600077.1 XdhC family protein [Streptomyces sp. LP11]